jgi:C1A family cysteine protease
MKYIKDHGITAESTYPYVAKTQSCQKKDGEFKISSFTQLDGCSGLYDGIAKQPVAITVDAQNWNDYKSGVFSNCGQRLNHAALLVGVINGVWKIKNEWGVSWGENGFIRLASGNTCGICLHPGVIPN